MDVSCIQMETRQIYNLFQVLWNRFIILVGGKRVQRPFGAKTLQAEKTNKTSGARCIKVDTKCVKPDRQKDKTGGTSHWDLNIELVLYSNGQKRGWIQNGVFECHLNTKQPNHSLLMCWFSIQMV